MRRWGRLDAYAFHSQAGMAVWPRRGHRGMEEEVERAEGCGQGIEGLSSPKININGAKNFEKS